MVEYHKSSAAFSLTVQLMVRIKLLVRVKLVHTITAFRSLGEDGLGGQRFLVLQHEAPAQSILTQRAQQKLSNPKSPNNRLKLRLTHLPKHKSLQISCSLHGLF